ncbi:methyl-accepting chemotaxis protein [Paenibacillus radicis (ex Xue et al. 2023)]|uniref:Methyl-accepting chemotaxis protein n=1 Tax=Paenibacillus radicis (ex Xue et al. 2023) TaxID=2972489 RepID=A0ABT1YNJ2_9BACL|nr:HAMP domain-containing methyl-accepting chemotaxis protein [Paenibacillus radicis (ex Xue et al. 2023)]MCR8634747.1 methyl-accepting chemotaxis protein [Paenibacillus radicis (ex Xue et al. 2023)]
MKLMRTSSLGWQRLFAPAVALMNKLRYPQKFLLIGCVFAIPIFTLTAQMFSTINTDIQFTEKEKKGLAYHQSLMDLMFALEQYGWSLHMGTSTAPSANKDTKGIGEQIDSIIYGLKQGANPDLLDPVLWASLEKQWELIKSNGTSISQNFYEIQHTALEQIVLLLIEDVQNSSNLILDPEFESYYLMDSVVTILPNYWTKLEKMELMGTEVVARQQIKNPQEQEELIRLTGDLEALLDKMNRFADLIGKRTPKTKQQMDGLLEANNRSTRAAIDAFNNRLLNNGVIQITADEMTSLSRNAKKANQELFLGQMKLLQQIFDNRLDSYKANKTKDILLIIIVVVVVVYLFTAFYLSVKRAIHHLVRASNQLSAGDLTIEVATETKDEFSQVTAAFNKLTDTFREVVRQSREVTEQAYESAEQLKSSVVESEGNNRIISGVMLEVAAGSSLQVQSAQETSVAMNEVNIGVQRIAETSSLVAGAAGDAAEEARKGSMDVDQAIVQMSSIKAKVGETASTIAELHELSTKIDRILSVVREISEQTRLLALNASIEAARAGEHGRGFQVVAAEVRKLADESSESTKQIAELIAMVQTSSKGVINKIEIELKEVERGSVVLSQVGVVFGAILSSVERVAEQIQEVSAASQQISASTEQVTATMEDSVQISRKASSYAANVKSSLDKQASSAKEVAASSESLNQLSEELLRSLLRFRIE